MNPEGLGQHQEKGGERFMNGEDIDREFNNVISDIHNLHEGVLEGYPKTDRKGAHSADVKFITDRHPEFGEFLASGDEVLELDEQAQKELALIEQRLFEEEASEEQRKELLQKFFDYQAAKGRIIPVETENYPN